MIFFELIRNNTLYNLEDSPKIFSCWAMQFSTGACYLSARLVNMVEYCNGNTLKL